ncbi:hypothetical protein P3S68_015451 [Capsicum galapagoense]
MIFGVSAVISAAKLKFFLRYNLAFIGALGELKFAGFGWSVLTFNCRHSMCGTLYYLPPELKELKTKEYVESVEHDANVDMLYALNLVVQEHESMVTKEQPHAMLIPMEYFLMGYGLYRPNTICCSYSHN